MQNLVIGATGIVGGYIVEQLVKSGRKPLALSRSAHESAKRGLAERRPGRTSKDQIPPFDPVYCTAGISLLTAALPRIATPALKRVVVSTSIITKRDSAIAYELDSVEVWAAAERQLAATCEAAGIGWTILRPTIIYAEGRDQNVTRIARHVRRFGVFPLMGGGAGLRQPVHAEDLAIGDVRAAACSFAINKTYALPGAETVSYREMVGRIFDALHRRRRIISAPPSVWRAAFALAGPFSPTPTSPWATAWRRTWCSTRRQPSRIMAGRRADSVRNSMDSSDSEIYFRSETKSISYLKLSPD
jgi:uncharacterized protein YbjT (DUF2867 family)